MTQEILHPGTGRRKKGRIMLSAPTEDDDDISAPSASRATWDPPIFSVEEGNSHSRNALCIADKLRPGAFAFNLLMGTTGNGLFSVYCTVSPAPCWITKLLTPRPTRYINNAYRQFANVLFKNLNKHTHAAVASGPNHRKNHGTETKSRKPGWLLRSLVYCYVVRGTASVIVVRTNGVSDSKSFGKKTALSLRTN